MVTHPDHMLCVLVPYIFALLMGIGHEVTEDIAVALTDGSRNKLPFVFQEALEESHRNWIFVNQKGLRL